MYNSSPEDCMSKVRTVSISSNMRSPEGRIRKINRRRVFRRSNWIRIIRCECADESSEGLHTRTEPNSTSFSSCPVVISFLLLVAPDKTFFLLALSLRAQIVEKLTAQETSYPSLIGGRSF